MLEGAGELLSGYGREMTYAAAGFGIGFLAGLSYGDVSESDDWHRNLLEEDPYYDDEDYSENFLMEAYYDNFDTVKRNGKEAFRAGVLTALLHGTESLAVDLDLMDLEDYPEVAGGIFVGHKAGRNVPGREDLENLYSNIVSENRSEE